MTGLIGVDPSTDRALARAVVLYDRADTEIRKLITARTREAVGWVRPIVAANARTNLDRSITATTRVAASQRLRVTMGTSGRLSTKTPIRDLTRQVEFGGNREAVATYPMRVRFHEHASGHAYPAMTTRDVTRHTQRQLPWRAPSGRLFYPAVAKIAPRLLAEYVAAVADYFDPDRIR